MNRLLTISFVVFFIPILLFAQWPTEPFTGLQLTNDPDHYEYIKAYCEDGEGGYYVCIEGNGHLFINHIDLNGNIRWPIDYPPNECLSDRHNGFPFTAEKRGLVNMTCNSDGEVWIAWGDHRNSHVDESGFPTSSDLYIQKFDQDRVAQWEPLTALLVQEHVDTGSEIWVSDHRGPRSIQAQEDGGVILVWEDTDQQNFDYEGNVWAQKFDTDGNPLWQTPGVPLIPDSVHRGFRSFGKYFSDGIGGVMFFYLNNPMRLKPNGELAWEYGESAIDRINQARWVSYGHNSSIIAIGDGRWQNGEENLEFATVIDTSGLFIHGPISIGNPEHTLPAGYIGRVGTASYGVIGFPEPDINYFVLNEELLVVHEPIIIDTFPHIRPDYGDRRISQYGQRIFSNNFGGQYQDTHHEMWGWDTLGTHIFTHGLNEDPYNVYWTQFTVDESGNTWVFWNTDYLEGDLYTNVISPEGEWGIASNGVDSPSSTSLPSDISLHVYPNPGNGQFNISFDLVDPSPATFILTNVLGQRIYSFELPRNAVASGLPGAGTGSRSGYLSLDLNDQASGTYFLQVRTESGQVQQKRIVLVK